MSNKYLSKQVYPLIPSQKPMDIPKVAGYSLNILLKLITNEQIIYKNGYDVTIRQIPYNEGYFKMSHLEDEKKFEFETIYRLDYSGLIIDQLFNTDHIGINVIMRCEVDVKFNTEVNINEIDLISIYDDELTNDKRELIEYELLENLKNDLIQNQFYEVDVISVY